MAATGTEPYARLREELCAVGFDVFQPMSAKWYNDYLKALDLATDSTSCAYLARPPVRRERKCDDVVGA
jgi:hypothetical protein